MRCDKKVREFNNYMWTNHRAAFQSYDNNIMKKKAMMQKQRKNKKINKNLWSNLRHLETIKMDRTYMNSSVVYMNEFDKEDAINIGAIGTVSKDLEIHKFEAFGLTSGLTSGSTPLAQILLTLCFSQIFHHQGAWHTLINLHNYDPCQKKKLQ